MMGIWITNHTDLLANYCVFQGWVHNTLSLTIAERMGSQWAARLATHPIDKVSTRLIEWDQGVSPFLFAVSG